MYSLHCHTSYSLFNLPKPNFYPNSPLRIALHNDTLATTNRHVYTFYHLILSVSSNMFLSLAWNSPLPQLFLSWNFMAVHSLGFSPFCCAFGSLGELRHSQHMNHYSKLRNSKSPPPARIFHLHLHQILVHTIACWMSPLSPQILDSNFPN